MFGGVSDAVNRNMDDPNPDMLLALLARNKALEGKTLAMLFIRSHLWYRSTHKIVVFYVLVTKYITWPQPRVFNVNIVYTETAPDYK